MSESVNQQIADRLVRRQILAGRVEAGLRRDVLERLAILEEDVLASVKAADPTQFVLLSRRRREVETLMDEEVDPLIQARYAALAALLDAALVRFARQEAAAVQEIVNTTADEEVIADVASNRQLRIGVTQSLFPSASKPTDLSAIGSDWWARAGASVSQRLRDQLTVSVSLEESLTQLTQRVRGTQAQGFNDGIMARARQDATRLLTTQMTNAVTEARMVVGDRNPARLIAIHQSVLDSRTSYVCLARNGLKYTLREHDPIGHTIPYLGGPPFHPNCRSTMAVVMENGGAVAQESTAQWLQRQGTTVQDELLGPTRAKLFRSGKLTPPDLLNAMGKPLTLEELGA
jgi:hypothetical protein